MTQVAMVDPETATGETKILLDGVRKAYGRVPNMTRAMAQSPALLQAYLGYAGGLGKGALTPKLKENIALAVAGLNACTYCASAHAAVGKMLGIGDAEAKSNLLGHSEDAKTEAALTFARNLVTKRGRLSQGDFHAVRQAGFGEDEIVEIIGHVGLNILTNYFNIAVGTEVDFPLLNPSQG